MGKKQQKIEVVLHREETVRNEEDISEYWKKMMIQMMEEKGRRKREGRKI